jgi:hypothetical protein
MECLHGKTASYNLLEGIYIYIYMRMQSHMKLKKDFVWNPVMVVKSVILVKGNMTVSWWTKTNDGKCMVYKRFHFKVRVISWSWRVYRQSQRAVNSNSHPKTFYAEFHSESYVVWRIFDRWNIWLWFIIPFRLWDMKSSKGLDSFSDMFSNAFLAVTLHTN